MTRGLNPVVRQHDSHTRLAEDESSSPIPSGRATQFDAIVVPASRGVSALRNAMRLSRFFGTTLVVLCSRESRAADMAALAAGTPGLAVLAVDVPTDYQHEILPARTTAERFRVASAGRRTDLSLKRNLGILLARLHGWSKILFLDDDIGSPAGPIKAIGDGLDIWTTRRLAAQLERYQVAGLVCRDFPDNSVVCHARRLAGFSQGNFVSGAALGVNCTDHPMPFFPDIYNEDWFFFSHHAANRELAQAGEARQAAYDPFVNPARAAQEEFGDVLAEGLYALFDRQDSDLSFARRLAHATEPYWEHFIAARQQDMDRTSSRLASHRPLGVHRAKQQALASLSAASEQLATLSPRLCVDFLHAWQDDLAGWARAMQKLPIARDTAEALEYLGLDEWEAVPLRRCPSTSGTPAARLHASPAGSAYAPSD